MKKLIMLVMAALMMGVSPLMAQDKALAKAQKKEMRQKVKQFTKEGWKIFGSTRTLEGALLTHYQKLAASDDVFEIPGVNSSFVSKNVGKQSTLTSACAYFASMMDSEIEGQVMNDMQSNANFNKDEFDKFYAAFKRHAATTIKGELKESFSVIRDKGDGTFEMQTFYLVDTQKAADARQRALTNAAAETKISQQYAKSIEDFIKAN